MTASKNMVKIKVLKRYKDMILNKTMYPGDELIVTPSRAAFLTDELGVTEIISY
jgi:hypothetical protein